MTEKNSKEYGGARPKESRRGHDMRHSHISGAFAGSYFEGPVTFNEQRVTHRYGEKDPEKESERYQTLCKVSERHVRTTLYNEVLNKLDNTDCVTVLGNAGDGKTTLLDLVSLEYGSRGYLTIQIDRPEDIMMYKTRDKPVLFVCDSFLGRILIDHDKKNSWVNCDRHKLTTDKVKLLFACRIELWREFETDLLQNPMFNYKVDVRSYKLTVEDKVEMLDQHLGNKVSQPTKRLIAENSNFAFPECCRFVSHSSDDIDFTDTDKLVDTFSKPLEFVRRQLKAIEKNKTLQYATLVFCLLNERKLPKTGTSDVLKQHNIEEVRKVYLSNKTAEELYGKFLGKAEELDGWLLTQQGDNYVFYHDSIHEAMSRVHGAHHPEHILTFCEPDVVFSVFTTKQVSGSDSDRVTLGPGCYPRLVEIVTRECVKRRDCYDSETWKFVFEEMNIADIIKEWSQLLKRKMPIIKKISRRVFFRRHKEPALADVLLLFTKIPDSGLMVDDIFMRATLHGDLKTSEILVGFGVTSDGKLEGLLRAGRKGHLDIVRMIVERGDLDMFHIQRGLREAVLFDRVELVREIIRLRPDVDPGTTHSLLEMAVVYDSMSCVGELMKRDIDADKLHGMLKKAVRYDRVKCVRELMRRDIDTDTIHSLLKYAVWCGRAKTVSELLKHPDISKQTVQNMIDKPDSYVFHSWVPQNRRDEIRTAVVKHLNTYS